jgi:hypothetical protein
MLNVQFFDSTETTIVSSFAVPQDASTYPNQGQVETSDPRWKAFFDLMNPAVQKYLPAPTSE